MDLFFLLKRLLNVKNKNWTDSPNGSGPFMLDEYLIGEKLLLKRNPDWYREPAKIEYVSMNLAGGQAMAMYEIFYLGKLKENERYLVRYKKNWPNDYGFRKKKDEVAIRSLKNLNKGRKNMREALGMNLETSTEDAVKRFWVLGEFLGLGQPKKLAKVDSELKKRKKLVNDYKLQITNLRKKLEEDEKKGNKLN